MRTRLKREDEWLAFGRCREEGPVEGAVAETASVGELEDTLDLAIDGQLSGDDIRGAVAHDKVVVAVSRDGDCPRQRMACIVPMRDGLAADALLVVADVDFAARLRREGFCLGEIASWCRVLCEPEQHLPIEFCAIVAEQSESGCFGDSFGCFQRDVFHHALSRLQIHLKRGEVSFNAFWQGNGERAFQGSVSGGHHDQLQAVRR